MLCRKKLLGGPDLARGPCFAHPCARSIPIYWVRIDSKFPYRYGNIPLLAIYCQHRQIIISSRNSSLKQQSSKSTFSSNQWKPYNHICYLATHIIVTEFWKGSEDGSMENKSLQMCDVTGIKMLVLLCLLVLKRVSVELRCGLKGLKIVGRLFVSLFVNLVMIIFWMVMLCICSSLFILADVVT